MGDYYENIKHHIVDNMLRFIQIGAKTIYEKWNLAYMSSKCIDLSIHSTIKKQKLVYRAAIFTRSLGVFTSKLAFFTSKICSFIGKKAFLTNKKAFLANKKVFFTGNFCFFTGKES